MCKTQKVYYLRRISERHADIVPHIRLAGKWLAAAGFRIGDSINISVDNGVITIRSSGDFDCMAYGKADERTKINKFYFGRAYAQV